MTRVWLRWWWVLPWLALVGWAAVAYPSLTLAVFALSALGMAAVHWPRTDR